jgi:hypothetical protein
VSPLRAEFDLDLEGLRARRLEQGVPSAFCDATYLKARVGGRAASKALVGVTGVNAGAKAAFLQPNSIRRARNGFRAAGWKWRRTSTPARGSVSTSSKGDLGATRIEFPPILTGTSSVLSC